MVRHNINRITYPCGCVVEGMILAEDNNDPIPGEERNFHLMNYVCMEHKHLASTQKKENHEELANVVLQNIEEAKRLNLEDWQAALNRARTPQDKLDVQLCLANVQRHNARITGEWQFLTSQTHAFDSHIHTTILDEIKQGKWQIQDS